MNIDSQSEAATNQSRPETFRLPPKGSDPYFGLTRSFYYEGEKRGYWRLVRLRERGKLRGITLVPYDSVSSFVRSQGVTAPPVLSIAEDAAGDGQ